MLVLLSHDGNLDDIRAIGTRPGEDGNSVADSVVGHHIVVLDLDQELVLIDDIESVKN